MLTATRDVEDDAHDRVLQGYVRGQRVLGAVNDNAPFSVGVDLQDYSTSPRVVTQDDGNRVTGFSSDEAGGYRIAYLVDGQPRTVTLAAVGNSSRVAPNAYFKREAEFDYFLLTYGSEYSSAVQWRHRRYADATSSDPEFGTVGYVVYGNRTAPESMPTVGSATYIGVADANVWDPQPASASVTDSEFRRGALSLRADFAAGTIAGEIDNLLTDRLAISGGRIQGNALSGDLSGSGYTGTVRGAFYGPAAEEAAGVMEATGADNTLLHGRFVGRKQ